MYQDNNNFQHIDHVNKYVSGSRIKARQRSLARQMHHYTPGFYSDKLDLTHIHHNSYRNPYPHLYPNILT